MGETYPANEIMTRTYGKFYKLVNLGKKEKAMQCLSTMQKTSFRGKWCCPKCGTLTLVSDMPSKDYVCLCCDKYYTNEELEDAKRKETEERIDRMVQQFMWYLDDNALNNAIIYGGQNR